METEVLPFQDESHVESRSFRRTFTRWDPVTRDGRTCSPSTRNGLSLGTFHSGPSYSSKSPSTDRQSPPSFKEDGSPTYSSGCVVRKEDTYLLHTVY